MKFYMLAIAGLFIRLFKASGFFIISCAIFIIAGLFINEAKSRLPKFGKPPAPAPAPEEEPASLALLLLSLEDTLDLANSKDCLIDALFGSNSKTFS
ncbi:hypothetical protein BCR32DRAFT_142349 [Anaeromyces robustus]|uniref:Uncharacterized protein n=1 Tax=Anaeromyces robustus TaxID=1754192 RepID=A0A1Y1XDF5_9FUNG|nr:hypothetical protein BCR32DRAFT_142349 [Anaeromyces robustus]|eukprot:ORX83769.1 hypothetical protein BCR32DRAFT_142349 [Anaeromyces robustus]